MVQDQLVDYISAQSKLGTSQDAIRAALVGAGWQPADVDDSFKKANGGGSASSSVSFSASAAKSATSPSPVIRMSDLVSASDGPLAMSTSAASVKTFSKGMSSAASAMPATKKGAMEFSAASDTAGGSKPPRSKGGLAMGIVGVIILGLGGLAGYLYMQNNSLSEQVATLSSQSSGVSSQIAGLTAQVNALTASGTALNSAVASAAAANQELITELSFYAVPPGGAVTSTPVSINGAVSVTAGKIYVVTTSYGTKISIQNSKDPKAIAALQPLVGVGAQFSGAYIPGTDMMTISSVNGKAL